MTKQEIRRQVLVRRDAMSMQERNRADLLVTERILGHQWYYLSEHLLVFLNFGSEIDTAVICRDAWEKGKKLYAPRVEGRDIGFYRITSSEDTVCGYKGIREPGQALEAFEYSSDLNGSTLMIMPGVAFDVNRNRLGYGKGFYDRYLGGKEEIRTIAIGYACQMVEEIPAEEDDVRPGQIICL